MGHSTLSLGGERCHGSQHSVPGGVWEVSSVTALCPWGRGVGGVMGHSTLSLGGERCHGSQHSVPGGVGGVMVHSTLSLRVSEVSWVATLCP